MISVSMLYVLVSLTTSVVGTVNTYKDQYHLNDREYLGNSLWVFGTQGVHMFSPDGSTQLKRIQPDEICHMVAGYRGGDQSLSCTFYDVVSDGKKYVWAAVSRGIPKIDILDINTGAVVGAFETCLSPRNLEYHPLREEIWVRCSQTNPNATYPSYMDVFSTASPSAAIQTDMQFKEDLNMFSWGYTMVDKTLGDVGYSTDWDQPVLTKLDLSSKSIIDRFDMPLGSGTYEMAYSPKNKHIFVRTSVCCTCGFEGADVTDCGRYGHENVTVTTGPFAGQTEIKGMCGRCDGVVGVDVLGVYEFDTTTDTIVGNHVLKENMGGDPFVSPDGRFILLIGRNGGMSIRILEVGATSEKSSVYVDLELGFNSTYSQEEQIYNDFAFIEIDGKTLLVFSPGIENQVVIVDITDGADNIKTTYIKLAEGRNTARKMSRQVEWAVGTPYVWIDGTQRQQIYVINVVTAELTNLITGLYTTTFLSVQNYARLLEEKMQQEAINEALEGIDFSVPKVASYVSTVKKDDNDVDMVGIIGIVVAGIALVVGIMNIVIMSKMKNEIYEQHDDVVSLGSKEYL